MPDYDKRNVALAKRLRRSMTPWERKLWYGYLRLRPEHFRRQKPIGPYIVDFSCEQARLVIELDGGGHYTDEQREKDSKRTADIEGRGLKVLRFSNREVDRNFAGVCECIERALAR